MKAYECPIELIQLKESLVLISPACSVLHPSESAASVVQSMTEKDVLL